MRIRIFAVLAAGRVFIDVVPFFDGGWGYEAARREEDLRMPAECHEHLRDGVYWHGPC
jgi:hypothetical protein